MKSVDASYCSDFINEYKAVIKKPGLNVYADTPLAIKEAFSSEEFQALSTSLKDLHLDKNENPIRRSHGSSHIFPRRKNDIKRIK